MEYKKFKHLTDEQVQCFMEHGYLRVKNCFSREASETWTKDVWMRLGFDPHDQSTWTRERTNMPEHRKIKVSEFAPKAWDAICELVGGEGRVNEKSGYWNDGFIVNLGTPEGAGKEIHPKELNGWHVDGDFFIHFLDSPEQGLLVIPLFTDILPNGGGTWICSEGVGKLAQWLYDHPQGVSPRMVPVGEVPQHEGLSFYCEMVQGCTDSSFHEMTGSVGDVILLHPLMLHSASKNGRRQPRIITNPPVSLKEPFNFHRQDCPEEYSLVELKTLKELGKDNLRGWKITARREAVVPERLKVQTQWKEEENARLEARGLQYNTAQSSQQPVAVA